MRWSCAALLASSACGRIGFDSLGSDSGPDPDAPVPPDRVRVIAFGPPPSDLAVPTVTEPLLLSVEPSDYLGVDG